MKFGKTKLAKDSKDKVIDQTASSSSKKTLSFNLKAKQYKKRIVLGISIIALATICIVLLLTGVLDKKSQDNSQPSNVNKTISREELRKVMDEKNCKTAVEKLKDAKSDNDNPSDNISLVSYRAGCYYELNQYPEALSSYEQLRALYVSSEDQDDKEAIPSVDATLKVLRGYVADPNSAPKNKEPKDLQSLSPELQEFVKSDDGGSR